MVRKQGIDLVVQRVGGGEVHQTDRAPRDLVLISGANAAFGCADLGSGDVSGLAMRVELAMQRQNQRNVLCDLEVGRGHFDSLAAQRLDLLDEMIGIEDDAVADDRQFSRPNNAGRKKCKFVSLAVDHESMARVMAALEPHHDVGADRQPIDDLALSFVAPLGADNDNIGQRRLLFRLFKRAKPRRSGEKPSRGPYGPSPKRSASLSKGAVLAAPPEKRAAREKRAA